MARATEEDRLGRRARRLFREADGGLDSDTRVALAQARRRAVDAAVDRRRRRTPFALAAVAAGAGALALTGVLTGVWPVGSPVPSQEAPVAQAGPSDLELLLAADSWAMYEELEFFLLLDALEDELESPADG